MRNEIKDRQKFGGPYSCITNLKFVYYDKNKQDDDPELRAKSLVADRRDQGPAIKDLSGQFYKMKKDSISPPNFGTFDMEAVAEEKDPRSEYNNMLEFEYGSKTLKELLVTNSVAFESNKFLRKMYMMYIAKALFELHECNFIHGNLELSGFVLVDDSNLKMCLLDLPHEINKAYKKVDTAYAFSPPEVVKHTSLSDSTNKETVKADIAHDLWSFGAILYRIETGKGLWECDNHGIITEKSMEELKGWCPSTLRYKLGFVKDEDAKRLLTLLLTKEPDKRCSNFVPSGQHDDGEHTMMYVLDHSYFTQDEKVMEELKKVFKGNENILERVKEMSEGVKKVQKGVEDLAMDVKKILTLSEGHSKELQITREVLIHAIYEADDVKTPTTFVILDQELSPQEETGKFWELEVADDGSGIQIEGFEQVKKWTDEFSNAVDYIEEKDPDNFFKAVKEKFSKLVNKKIMYFYLIDELTGEPVEGEGYPIPITEPSKFVHKMMPFIQCSMHAMSLYNGVGGICKMFGIPVPTLSESDQKHLRESVHILKQKSSVETFAAVHEKVEEKDGQSKTVRGRCLKELETFLHKYDKDKSFAGLCRIAGTNGGAIWTHKNREKEEIKRLLEERAKLRKKENDTDIEYLRESRQSRHVGLNAETAISSEERVDNDPQVHDEFDNKNQDEEKGIIKSGGSGGGNIKNSDSGTSVKSTSDSGSGKSSGKSCLFKTFCPWR